jgi:prepilin-type N-terminal cleavage/methylation domain-containing protein
MNLIKQRRGSFMKKEQGFSLIELLIVVAIIAIIAAIAVPSMLTSRMAANEAGAISGCRTIGSAEVAYAAVNNQAYADLDTLVDGNYLDERFASDSEGFNGYAYTDEALGFGTGDAAVPDGFHFKATPASADSSGRYIYGIAADQVVRFIGVAGAADPPAGLEAGDPIGKKAAAGG